MCMIIAKTLNISVTTFKDIDLYSIGQSNPDGVGVHIIEDNEIKRFMDTEKSYEYIKNALKSTNRVMIHFRWGTSGTVGEHNIHPFKLVDNENKLLYLSMNGVLPFGTNFVKYCDTAVLARLLEGKSRQFMLRFLKGLNEVRFTLSDKDGITTIGRWHSYCEGIQVSRIINGPQINNIKDLEYIRPTSTPKVFQNLYTPKR